MFEFIIYSAITTLTLITKVSTNVTFVKEEYSWPPRPREVLLQCNYTLEVYKQFVQRIDITKDDKVFYSVEYYTNGNQTTNFTKVPGINELALNFSALNFMQDAGWVIALLKNTNKSTAGLYKCLIFYNEDNKLLSSESEAITIINDQEKVELKVDKRSKKFKKGSDIRLSCKYHLVKNDSFVGLSLLKDRQEFYRFINEKNHTFTPIEGIKKITWSTGVDAIHLTVKNAINYTAGDYRCEFNFSHPYYMTQIITLSDDCEIKFNPNCVSIIALSKLTLFLSLLSYIYMNFIS